VICVVWLLVHDHPLSLFLSQVLWAKDAFCWGLVVGRGVLWVGSFWCWCCLSFSCFLSVFLLFCWTQSLWVSLVPLLCLCLHDLCTIWPFYYLFFYVYIIYFPFKRNFQALWITPNIAKETSTWHTNFHTSISLHRFKSWEFIWERAITLKFFILSIEIVNIVFWASSFYHFYWELNPIFFSNIYLSLN